MESIDNKVIIATAVLLQYRLLGNRLLANTDRLSFHISFSGAKILKVKQKKKEKKLQLFCYVLTKPFYLF